MAGDQQPGPHVQPTLLQRFLGSRLVTGAGMALSRHVPPPVGHGVAWVIAGLINLLRPNVYRIVYANLRQVVGPEASDGQVHRLVRRVFGHNARNLYDLWHAASQGVEAVRRAVHVPPEAVDRLDQALRRGKGVIVVGTHTGNFDLAIMALAARQREVQILGLAVPPGGGFSLMDDLRKQAGALLTSIDVQALRMAVRRLRAGGIVLTGVDRPSGGEEAAVEFFGRPARLPTGHVRLALKTDAAILVGGPYYSAAGRHTVVQVSPPLVMERSGDPEEDLRRNLRQVTTWMEEYIRARPEQWAMFLSVWPEEGL